MSCPAQFNDFCNTVVLNPDITGTGVRVAIYAQTIISMAVASCLPYHKTAFRNTSRNTYVASTSLILASLIQWKTSGLSLLDALIVTMLTTLMTAFVTANSPYIRTLGLSISVSSFLFTALWCYWGLQVWASPASFGLPDGTTPTECNASINTVFVVFGINISVQNGGLRGFAIFVFGINIIVAISTLYQCIMWPLRYFVDGPRAAKDKAAVELAIRVHKARTQAKCKWGKGHITRFGGVVGVAYMIVTTEFIVARNTGASSGASPNRWTYSQTIALVMLGQQLMDCFTYFKEEIQYRRRQRAMMRGETCQDTA